MQLGWFFRNLACSQADAALRVSSTCRQQARNSIFLKGLKILLQSYRNYPPTRSLIETNSSQEYVLGMFYQVTGSRPRLIDITSKDMLCAVFHAPVS
jgi:hypothetical protein